MGRDFRFSPYRYMSKEKNPHNQLEQNQINSQRET